MKCFTCTKHSADSRDDCGSRLQGVSWHLGGSTKVRAEAVRSVLFATSLVFVNLLVGNGPNPDRITNVDIKEIRDNILKTNPVLKKLSNIDHPLWFVRKHEWCQNWRSYFVCSPYTIWKGRFDFESLVSKFVLLLPKSQKKVNFTVIPVSLYGYVQI